jgi:hypothetical protein
VRNYRLRVLGSIGVVCRDAGTRKTIIVLITLAAIGLDPLLARIESCTIPRQSGVRADDRFIPASIAGFDRAMARATYAFWMTPIKLKGWNKRCLLEVSAFGKRRADD